MSAKINRSFINRNNVAWLIGLYIYISQVCRPSNYILKSRIAGFILKFIYSYLCKSRAALFAKVTYRYFIGNRGTRRRFELFRAMKKIRPALIHRRIIDNYASRWAVIKNDRYTSRMQAPYFSIAQPWRANDQPEMRDTSYDTSASGKATINSALAFVVNLTLLIESSFCELPF